MKKIVVLLFGMFAFLGFGFAQEYIFYYGNGCPHCANVEKFFKKNDIEKKFDVVSKEVYFNRENLKDLQSYVDKLQLSPDQVGVPMMIINGTGGECSYLAGDTPIIDYFDQKLAVLQNTCDHQGGCDQVACNHQDCTNEICEKQNVVSSISGKVESSLSGDTVKAPLLSQETKKRLSFFGIMLPAAISDSINPCAFAVMLLLLSSILSRHQSRRKTLLAGGMFALAVFVSYFAMGIGLFSALASASNTFVLKLIVGILGILVGLANLKDFFWYGKFFVMEVPFSWRPKMADMIDRVSSPWGAFVVGLLVSLFLLPCSSGPYFTILGYLSSESKELHSWGYLYLFVYNLLFILPMVVIAILVAFGYSSVDKLAKFKHKNTKLIHLIVGLLMLGLGIYVLVSM